MIAPGGRVGSVRVNRRWMVSPKGSAAGRVSTAWTGGWRRRGAPGRGAWPRWLIASRIDRPAGGSRRSGRSRKKVRTWRADQEAGRKS